MTIHRDLSDPAAQSHAPDLSLIEGHNDHQLLEIDLSDHSETEDHHTSWIEVLLDETPAGWIKLDPELFGGRIQFSLPDLVIGDRVRVRARCNRHGVWENTLET